MADIVKTKNKGQCELATGSDLEAIGNVVRFSLKRSGGRPAIFSSSQQGLEEFRKKSIEYFDYVAAVNQGKEAEKALVPDIESWATYLGTTRQSIFRYEQRGREWRETIQLFKNAIASVKKQLGLHYKIPPMIFAFDFANNHGYVNTNEFKLTVEPAQDKEQEKRSVLEAEIRENGLIWDETTHTYIEDKGVY